MFSAHLVKIDLNGTTGRSFGAIAGRNSPRLDRLEQSQPELQVLHLSVKRVFP
jgi:hypothetical protein